MNVKERKAEIRAIDFSIPELTQLRDRLASVRRLILGSDPKELDRDRQLLDMLKSGRVRDVSRRTSLTPGVEEGIRGWDGRGIDQLTSEIEHLKERRAALVATLPSRDEISQARQEHREFTSKLEAENSALVKSWQRFLTALMAAEVEGREVARAYRVQKHLASQASNVIERVDLTDARVEVASLDSAEVKLAQAISSLLSHVSIHHSIDPGVEKGLERLHEAVKNAPKETSVAA